MVELWPTAAKRGLHGRLARYLRRRERADSKTACCLEVTNFGTTPARDGIDPGRRRSRRIRPASCSNLEAGAASRIILNLASGSGELRATLADDDLAIDNDVVLVSPRRRPLRVQARRGRHGQTGRRICDRC